MADAAGPLVFYAAHQDDETLVAGHLLAHHVLAGREVHVVCATDGAASRARRFINGEVTSSWWGVPHDLAVEGYSALSPAEFSAARSRELINACAALGVPATRVHFEGLPDGGVTAEDAKRVFRSYAALLPGAAHCTLSPVDPHPDHATLGASLRWLHATADDRASFADVRFVLKPEQAPSVPSHYPYLPPTDVRTEVSFRVANAARCYGAWAPRTRSYAVGWHSSNRFRGDLDLPNYVHEP